VADERVHLPAEAMSTWMAARAEDQPGRRAKHRLVATARSLVEAIHRLDVSDRDPGPLDAARAHLAAVVAELEGRPHFAQGASEAGADDSRLLERSGISGASNPLSPPVHVELDGDRVVGWAEYGYAYEGPPGCVHGGYVAAAFDDLLGIAQTITGSAGFTGTLTVRMVRPTPLHRRIDYEGGVRTFVGRKITAWARATCDGEVVAEGEGIFITPRAGMEDERMIRAAAPMLPEVPPGEPRD
jgi:hypothetical protein